MKIDFNCDLAEGMGVEELIMPHISSANISCGLHAGSPSQSAYAITLAKKHGVRIGAHPSFDDRANFGRTNLSLSQNELRELLAYQLGAFASLCDELGASFSYVKPHGALYNMAAKDEKMSEVIVKFIADFNQKRGLKLALMGLSNSEMMSAANRAGLEFISEVFGDRAYTDEGTLVPRGESGAVITDENAAIAQVLSMTSSGKVVSINDKEVAVKADSLCVHGDGAHAVEFVLKIKAALNAKGIKVSN